MNRVFQRAMRLIGQPESPRVKPTATYGSPVRAPQETERSTIHPSPPVRMFATAGAPPTSRVREPTFGATPMADLFANCDPVQVSLMTELCIVVDNNDQVVGTGSKKDCHLMSNIDEGLLHRAFSVFLFNSTGKLLLQQRSDAKITFPGAYTNTCCSHPLATPAEMTENPIEGVKLAAQRRMFIELGIPPEELPLSCFHYLTRIKYKAPSDGMWGEHEIDYILFVQKDIKTISPNPNEIKSIRYLAQNEVSFFLDEIKQKNEHLTPWFELILNSSLHTWWRSLDSLNNYDDHENIHQLN